MSYYDSLEKVIIHGGFPIPLYWEGWNATTHILKGNGWEILASENKSYEMDAMSVWIGATSPDSSLMLAGQVMVPYGTFHGARFTGQNYGEPVLSHLTRGGLKMGVYKAKDVYKTYSEFDISSFNSMRPINPYATTSGGGDFSKLKCFSYKDEGPSIYIPPSSESELLDMLLKVQYPNQQEIKKKLVLPETKPIIKAQIFSLVA